MALQIVQEHGTRTRAKLRTHAAEFCCCPAHEDGLLEVRSGQSAEYALTQAICLADSIKSLAQGGVDHGIDEETSYLISFTADAIGALLDSVHVALEQAEIASEHAA